MRYRVDRWEGYGAEGIGEAGAIGDFAEYASDPNFSHAWAQVEGQLKVEGTPVTLINATRDDFAKQFGTLISAPFSLDNDTGTAARAAQIFAEQAHTVMGAVQTVTGLVNDLTSQTPKQALQTFTGTVIAIAAAASGVTAGVGALIAAGVGVVLDLLDQAHLFGPPPGLAVQGCPNLTVSRQPDIVVGCVTGWGPARIEVGSANWRSFPVPGFVNDLAWYQTGGDIGQWRNVTWTNPLAQGPSVSPFGGPQGFSMVPTATLRPIDVAFPNYGWVEGSARLSRPLTIAVVPSNPGHPFQKAFANAWRGNQEYALNGLKPQDDVAVLKHLLTIWNRTHEGPGWELTQDGPGGTYIESLVTQVQNQSSSSDGYVSSNGILVNRGAMVSVPTAKRVVDLQGLAHISKTATVSGGSLVAMGALGIGAVAVAKPALLRSVLAKIGVRL